MYTITDKQEKEIQSFIDKLPDSMVKSNVTNLFNEVFPTNRMTVEQLEKFLSYQNALPKEFQTYPQTFAQLIKNPHPDTANILAESHAHIAGEKISGDKGKQKQEILHTLNVEDKTLKGTKATPKFAEDQPTYEEKLKSEAKESAKTSGGKPEAQKKEEESIIARNREVSDEPKTKDKPKVVVVEKKK